MRQLFVFAIKHTSQTLEPLREMAARGLAEKYYVATTEYGHFSGTGELHELADWGDRVWFAVSKPETFCEVCGARIYTQPCVSCEDRELHWRED